MKYIVYINYKNGSEPSLFKYPTLEHARKIGDMFITQNGEVLIFESECAGEWGSLKLVEVVKFSERKN